MSKLIHFIKDIVLDLLSMFKGFLYGFVMIGLFIVVCAALIYGILFLKNIIF